MQLEDYFDFETFDSKHGVIERIRIKGHRISIEHVIELFKQGESAEVIQSSHYPSLSQEKVFATLTYYLHNKEAVEAYLRRGEAIAEAFYQEYLLEEPAPFMKRIEALRAERTQAQNVNG